jgi:uncharacterized protein YecA (UPF0149 family)
MDEYQINFVEDLDKSFKGLQSIYNWAPDFEMELSNASAEDKSFAQKRIDFCTEFITRSKDKNGHNIIEFKRAIAESYFYLGKKDEGEKLFEELVKRHPTVGWVWIGWSDQYWIFAQKKNKDKEKAVNILKQTLEVEGLKDKFDVLERLKDLYTELNVNEEAEQIQQKMMTESRNSGGGWSPVPFSVAKPTRVGAVKTEKIGRNDPCVCGSGKKYKKCCGK